MSLIARIAFALVLASIASLSRGEKPIVIAHIAPMTGDMSALGHDRTEVLQVCVASINARGGIRGRKVKLLVRDDGFDSDRYVADVEELMQGKEKPVALLGGGLGVEKALKSGLLDQYKVPVIGPVSGSLAIRYPFSPYVFHTRASYADEINKMINQLEITGRRRIGVVYVDVSDGKAGFGLIRLALKSKGMELAGSSSVNIEATDVEPQVKAMLALEPDTIIFLGLEQAAGNFLLRYRTLGGKAQLYVPSFVDSVALVKVAGAENARGTGMTQVVPFPFSRGSQIAKDYQSALRKFAPAAAISYQGLETFVACRVFEEGMKAAGPSATGSELIAALEKNARLDLGGYVLTYGPDNHLGSRFVDITVIGGNGQLMQ